LLFFSRLSFSSANKSDIFRRWDHQLTS
jgi:hypothetical protein